jgi:hypothetical protein
MKAHISSTVQGSQVRKRFVMAACGAALALAVVAGLRAWQVAGRDGSTAVPAASQQAAPATADGHTDAVIGASASPQQIEAGIGHQASAPYVVSTEEEAALLRRFRYAP